LERKPRPFPKIRFQPEKLERIEDFTSESIFLDGYNPYPAIKMEMAL